MSTPEAAEPRAAATLVILRDSERGPEVLVTVRPKAMRFMGGVTVFPGGAVAGADLDPRWEDASALDRGAAATLMDLEPDKALGLFVCALRESFEEVGFLLGSHAESLEPADADDPNHFLEQSLATGATLATDALVPAGRWVTPLGAPVRFDTWFFIARAPEGWEPVPDPSEVETCAWVTPAESLEDLSAGRVVMAPPTIEMLQHLQGAESVEVIISTMSERMVDGPGKVLSVPLSPLVRLIVAPNPSAMTGPGTNTYVVGSGPTIVIDPAVDDEDYIAELRARAGDVQVILITHRHEDHVGGVAALQRATGAPVRAYGDSPAGGFPVTPVDEGEVFEVGGATLRTMYCPGHASDHLCWYMEGAASLFAGDNILGEGTAVIAPPDGDMRTYLSTLRRLSELHIDRIFTGHFRPLDGGRQVIQGYLAHRAEREEQVTQAMASGATTPTAIVEKVYVDTPQHLHPVAEQQVLSMLEVLEADGRVQREGETWRLVDR
jgi:glyoxylase-like metal-dependent hydrolase (beta-lactamase superfamily II)/8-oxo-dGTP pyrophosphatase MutT (NUDIX family)